VVSSVTDETHWYVIAKYIEFQVNLWIINFSISQIMGEIWRCILVSELRAQQIMEATLFEIKEPEDFQNISFFIETVI